MHESRRAPGSCELQPYAYEVAALRRAARARYIPLLLCLAAPLTTLSLYRRSGS